MADKTTRGGGEPWRIPCAAGMRARTGGGDDPRRIRLG
jgi:hypothetical protein